MRIANAQRKVRISAATLRVLKRGLLEAAREEGVATSLLTVVLVDRERMQELNQRFLRRNGSTDVLAFPLEEPEIYICAEDAWEAASSEEHLARELLRLAVHGLLHLAGYDHKSEEEECLMRRKERRYVVRASRGS